MAATIVEERYWRAASLVSEIPARIPTTQHLGSIMNLVFYEAASKRRKATFSDLLYMKNTDPLRFSTGIAFSSTFRSLCEMSFEAPPTPVLLNKFNEVSEDQRCCVYSFIRNLRRCGLFSSAHGDGSGLE
jgi:hypothetical protein